MISLMWNLGTKQMNVWEGKEKRERETYKSFLKIENKQVLWREVGGEWARWDG